MAPVTRDLESRVRGLRATFRLAVTESPLPANSLARATALLVPVEIDVNARSLALVALLTGFDQVTEPLAPFE